MKLEPEYRAQQACVIKGLDVLRHDVRFRDADRIKTGTVAPPVLDGTLLTAKQGAVRLKHRWFALPFTCKLTPDFMKATAFSFELRAEIPKEKWDSYGLWY
jgi:hypothetical protein